MNEVLILTLVCLIAAATSASAFVVHVAVVGVASPITHTTSRGATTAAAQPSRHQRQQQRLWASINPDSVHTDNDWHPQDPSHTTPRLLQGIWDQIANAKTMVRGETDTVIYPQMEEKLNQSPRFLNLIMAHLDSCKDVCDHFGITTSVVPFLDPKTRKITGFTVKSFRDPNKQPQGDGDEDGEFKFDYDPFWDDGTDFETLYKGVDEEEEGGVIKDPYPEIANKIPSDDDEIIDITKKWVGKLMSDMGICPFTASPEQAGLPIGNVFYTVERCTSFEEMYAAYWAEVVRVESKDEKELSTTLLIAPEFCLDQIDLFESFSNTLTQPLTALGIEDMIQLVFFHPQWSFRDGDARASSAGQAANYARRSPWPMINILRTKQVRAAQKGIPTGLVYKQNEKTLASIGVESLETMLRLRDWSDISDLKVNRREFDALKIAQDFQSTGVVRQEDMSLVHDATPAANRVDRKQVDQGNLVNVVRQAMEKRLGKGVSGSATPLSGPETSATSMATDLLLEQLELIAAGGGGEELSAIQAPATIAVVTKGEGAETDVKSESAKEKAQTKVAAVNVDEKEAIGTADEVKEYKETDELRKLKAARMEEARNALFADLRDADAKSSNPSGRPDALTDAMFGGAGITKMLTEEEEFFAKGNIDPDEML